MKVYKATDKDMKCRGLQYEIGKTVESEGPLSLCNNGLHACEAPLELFDYYSPADGSRYFEAEADDVSQERSENSSKIVAKKLTLGAEIGIPGLVKAHVEYVKAHTTTEHTDPKQATAGDSGAATAGDSGAATAGSYGAATAGFYGAATAGSYGAATAGSYGAATAGFYGAATAGSYGAATAGDSGAATAGFRGAATAGSYGAATAGSYGAATAGFRGAATAGDSGAATAGNSGAATAGSYGAATAGFRGAATARGSAASGENGMSVVRGNGVKAKGGLGAVIVIAIENDDDYAIKEWKAGVIDGKTLKADTWYTLKDGEFVEVE